MDAVAKFNFHARLAKRTNLNWACLSQARWGTLSWSHRDAVHITTGRFIEYALKRDER